MDDREVAVWHDALARIQTQHPSVWRRWFHEIQPVDLVGGTVYLRAPNIIQRDYLRRECVDPFVDALNDSTGRLVGVRFLGPGDALPAAGNGAAEPSRSPGRAAGETMHGVAPAAVQATTQGTTQSVVAEVETYDERRDDIPGRNAGDGVRMQVEPKTTSGVPGGVQDDLLDDDDNDADFDDTSEEDGDAPRRVPVAPVAPRTGHSSERHASGDAVRLLPDYSFDQFVIGPNNRLAHAAALAVAARPGKAYNPLFVHGGVGLGKTHLLHAICQRVLDKAPGTRLHYVSCDQFMSDFMDAVQSGLMTDFRHTVRDVDLIVVDDIHFLAKRDRTQEEFFHTFNTLYQANKQIVLSSDAAPEEIPDLEDRLVSRFQWGLVAKIDPPTYETRVQILKTNADLRGLDMPDDAACHLANVITANIRELEGAITKLQIMASLEKGPISLAMAEAAFPGTQREKPRLTIDAIMDVVIDFYQVKRTELLGKKRHKSISLPRQVCMALARKHTRHSLEEIGAHFGGRDHTTVIYACEKIDKAITENGQTASQIEQIERQLING